MRSISVRGRRASEGSVSPIHLVPPDSAGHELCRLHDANADSEC